MRFFVALLALAYVCDARPSNMAPRAALSGLGFGSFILNGQDAQPGEFPWQLSQERANAVGTFSHSCGASLLGPTRALSAAHCVDGAAVNILRVIAGLHDRSNPGATNAQTANLISYKMHEAYNQGAATFNNDIAILNLATAIVMNANVQPAVLPGDAANQFTGEICVMSGWGRTSASNTLPNTLQKASIPVISEAECNQRMAPVSGALTGPGQICLYDGAGTGSCNGDSGGPLNCQDRGQSVVAGVTSWGIQSGGACAPSYPSVYTRTSNFLDWIAAN